MTPSMVCPRRWAARYAKTGIRSGVFLRDSEDLLDGGEPLARPGEAVHAQRHHPALDRVVADVAGGGAAKDEAAGVLVDDEELVDAGAAPVAGPATLVAALAPEQHGAARGLDAERVEVGLGGSVRH